MISVKELNNGLERRRLLKNRISWDSLKQRKISFGKKIWSSRRKGAIHYLTSSKTFRWSKKYFQKRNRNYLFLQNPQKEMPKNTILRVVRKKLKEIKADIIRICHFKR